jgi:hypothetical protein
LLLSDVRRKTVLSSFLSIMMRPLPLFWMIQKTLRSMESMSIRPDEIRPSARRIETSSA